MDIFDGMAARYDNDERAAVANIIATAIRGRVQGCEAKAAIDYGCGTGLVGLQLAGCFKTLLMVDAAPGMVEQVQRKAQAQKLQNVKPFCANFAENIPENLSADIIFMAQVLLHIPDTMQILTQLYDLLNPGGQLIIVDFNKEESIHHEKVHNGFVQQELVEALKQIGFARVEAETFYHGKNIFMNKDASLFLLDAFMPT